MEFSCAPFNCCLANVGFMCSLLFAFDYGDVLFCNIAFDVDVVNAAADTFYLFVPIVSLTHSTQFNCASKLMLA